MEQHIRWEVRFANYTKALNKLTQAIEFINGNREPEGADEGNEVVLDEMVRDGLIQRFEYTHELAWNVMKDYGEYQGNTNIGGSRDATREAFQLKLISSGNVWMDMIGSRNKTSHTYNEEIADEIYSKILKEYYPAFLEFHRKMETKKNKDQGNLL